MFVSYLAGTFSGRHPQTVALDIGISGIRLISVMLIMFWSQDLVGKEIDRRTVFIALTYPRKRSSYLLGRYIGVCLLVCCAILILAFAVYGVVALAGADYHQAFSVSFGWRYGLVIALSMLDAICIAAFVFLIGSLATTALLPMALGAAFAIAARSFSTMIGFLLDKSGEGADIAPTFLPMLHAIGWVLPDLGKLDIRDIVLYSSSSALAPVAWPIIHTCAYAAISLALACIIFERREFQ